MEIYYCKKCKYLFRKEAEPDACPDCGSNEVIKANKEQQKEYCKQKEICRKEKW